MFPMRLKLGPTRNNEWICCFCLHVRTATILLGIWHLVLHVFALTVLALIMRNHHIVVSKTNDFAQNDFLPTPLSKIKDNDNPYFLPTTQDGRPIYSTDIDMGALMTICTLSITLLMVYGVIKGKPSHILPFFCLQLFDFAITTLTATGYFCYLRSVHRLVAEHWHNLPYRKELLELSPQYLSLIVLAAFLISMLWKAYCIGIVWRCYKFLSFRQQTRRNTIHYILPGDGGIASNAPDYPRLFRDQEAAFGASVLKQTPPPSYQDVMEDQPPPYPVAGATTEPVPFNVYSFAPSAETVEPADNEETLSQPGTSRIEADIEVNQNTQPVSEGNASESKGAIPKVIAKD